MIDLEKVAAQAFIDELGKILPSLQGEAREKFASAFAVGAPGVVSAEQVVGILKEAGFFDRMKGFVQGGSENGIPMHSLGSMMSQSNPFTGMGSSLAASARQAGGAIADKARGAGAAAGNFIRGGNQNGIPMHSLGSQLSQSNPFTGMGASLANAAGSVGKLLGGGGGGGAPARATPPPLPARAGGGGMQNALMSGLASAKSNPFVSMHLG